VKDLRPVGRNNPANGARLPDCELGQRVVSHWAAAQPHKKLLPGKAAQRWVNRKSKSLQLRPLLKQEFDCFTECELSYYDNFRSVGSRL
jgi:hypothetical protein